MTRWLATRNGWLCAARLADLTFQRPADLLVAAYFRAQHVRTTPP